jgi:hypothetical protein
MIRRRALEEKAAAGDLLINHQLSRSRLGEVEDSKEKTLL